MSIEKQLKHEYVRTADALRCPSGVDVLVHSKWKQESGVKPWYRARIPRRVIGVALSLMLFTGFAYSTQQLLFSEQRDGFFWEISRDSSIQLDPSFVAGIHQQLEGIRQQLPVGQFAHVYLSDLDRNIPYAEFRGILSVGNPELETDFEDWRAALQQARVDLLDIPEQLPYGFSFQLGKKTGAFNEIVVDDMALVKELEQEAKQANDGVAMRLMEAGVEPQQGSYTTVYVNEAGEYIYVTVNEFPENVTGFTVTTPDSSQYASVAVHGETAHYIVNDQSFLSPTQLAKTVSWLHEGNGQTVMYTVTTDADTVTKEQLIAAAESLQ